MDAESKTKLNGVSIDAIDIINDVIIPNKLV